MQNITCFQTTGRIVMGPGSLSRLPDEIKRLGASRVFIVTDPGLVQAGVVDRLENVLRDAGIPFGRFDRVEPDPRYEIVNEALQRLKSEQWDLVIGIGGGSSIDIAKVVAVLALNDAPVTSYFGVDLIPKPGLKTILIPTTAGTGSEVTPIAILSDHHDKLKKGVVSPYLLPGCALLDPELTLGLPAHVTAATGMDALIHAIEAYTSKNATSFTDHLAVRAMELIHGNIRTACADGSNIDARGKMLEGSLLAGMAFANAGVTAVHAFAYPIGAEFHIPHGIANTIMLLPVMEFNLMGNLKKFGDIARIFGQNTEGVSERKAAQLSVEAVRELTEDLNVPRSLRDYGVREEHVPDLAEGVMKVTRLLVNNPRVLGLEDAKSIYRRVL
ncbi:MAG: iron-containing alcohol dehydrogenase [Deltaproteobacteria bacterium]|nr:iron-containing alcohol dehydrogenase [Deltaproteobacteria bacterium]